MKATKTALAILLTLTLLLISGCSSSQDTTANDINSAADVYLEKA